MKNAVNTDLHFVGHSYGGQMVTAAAYTLAKMYDQGLVVNPACVPDRVSLADPYIPSEALGGYTKGTLDIIGESYDAPLAQVTANAIAYLNSRGTFVDLYGGMSFIYENYANTLPDLKDTIKANTAYISLDGLLGDMSTKHVNARDYVLTNLVDGIAGNITSLPFTVAVSAEDGRAFRRQSLHPKGPRLRLDSHFLCQTGIIQTSLGAILFGAFAQPKLANMYTIACVPPVQNHPKISCSEV